MEPDQLAPERLESVRPDELQNLDGGYVSVQQVAPELIHLDDRVELGLTSLGPIDQTLWRHQDDVLEAGLVAKVRQPQT